jgi:hypothetical protein
VEGREDEADISITTRDIIELARTNIMFTSTRSVRAGSKPRISKDLNTYSQCLYDTSTDDYNKHVFTHQHMLRFARSASKRVDHSHAPTLQTQRTSRIDPSSPRSTKTQRKVRKVLLSFGPFFIHLTIYQRPAKATSIDTPSRSPNSPC